MHVPSSRFTTGIYLVVRREDKEDLWRHSDLVIGSDTGDVNEKDRESSGLVELERKKKF